jgi:hypothetical protein
MTTRTRGRRGKYETDIHDMERAADAARLRAMGLSYRQIGNLQGVSNSTAHDRVMKALAAVPVESVSELRAIEVVRIDLLIARAFDEFERNPHTSLAVIESVRRLSESRRKLLGLDFAQNPIGGVSASLIEEIEQLACELGLSAS